MAFGGFGGFGQNNNNNNQQSSGFGGSGFGSSNAGTGFGTQSTNTGFGATNTGATLFGSTGGGFGSNSASPFGNKTQTGFGAANTPATGGGGGGLFGSNNTSSGFGGAGGGTTSGFGGNAFGSGTSNNTTTGGGMFGSTQNKSTFGTGGGGGGGLFGQSNNTTSSTPGFGQAASGGGMFGGGAANTECQGTANPAFNPVQEKEGASNTTNNFQSISCMGPYQKFSFEELRLADYAQGRRFGNASGQPGAFGQSNFGGGFGNTSSNTTNNNSTGFGVNNTTGGGGGGLFGASASSSSGFGANQATSGFGSGGLFGAQQNKPAGGLFGAASTTGQATGSTPSTGGLFGAAGTGFGQQQPQQQQQGSTGGFGAGSGGLFGQQNNQQKSGFAFGNQNSTAATSSGGFGGFGSTAPAGGGLFGNNQSQNQAQPQAQGGGLFGNNQQSNTPNMFGQQNQSQNQGQAAGGFGGFGQQQQQNQQKPGGLFGGNAAAPGGGGLFGNTQNNQQQSTGGGLFGNNNNQAGNAAGGLFGAKPANTTGGMFGNSTANTNTNAGGGLFGGMNNNQPQQNAGGGLFGNAQQQQKPGGLFGSTNAGGGGLFGNNQQNNQGGGMFGQNNNQNQNSLFGGSTTLNNSQQNSLLQPQGLTASVNDPTPYGSASIFNGLPPPPQGAVGPIATPISSGQRQKKHAALPQYKINPAMASRLVTPRKQTQGYGFSYSTYGTPSSVSSVASTPGGLSNSLLGGSLSRSLGKSLSTSNLRRTFDTDNDSVLSPGAFSSSSNRYTGGSLKRLTIDRSLRTDLFGPQAMAALPSPERNDLPRTPSILKKKVSFDAALAGGETNGTDISATPTAQEQGYLRPQPSAKTNGSRTTGMEQPEMQQVSSRELTVVHEDGSPENSRAQQPSVRKTFPSDLKPGDYWIQPPLDVLKRMSSPELKSISNVVIGRKGCGHCAFNQPVDLSNIDLNELLGGYANIKVRSITIYPQSKHKPPPGQGLNVPSTLTIENCWVLGRDKKTPLTDPTRPLLEKHVERLKKMADTEFVEFNAETGIWVFKVPHFTTYGLEYEGGNEDQSEVDFSMSTLSELPPTPTPKHRTPNKTTSPLSEKANEEDTSMVSATYTNQSSEPEDTFAFKTGPRFPGAFDDVPAFEEDEYMDSDVNQNGEHFLGARSVSSRESEDEPSDMEEITPAAETFVRDEGMDLIGSFPAGDAEDVFPKSILKASRQPTTLGTPAKGFFDMENDWTEQLQRTISPKKQDRVTLRQNQEAIFRDLEELDQDTNASGKQVNDGGEITTSIDLMNSLFGKEHVRRSTPGRNKTDGKKGFKWPYKKSKLADIHDMNNSDRAFHDTFKPSWGPGDVLVYSADGQSNNSDKPTATSREIGMSSFKVFPDITEGNMRKQVDQANISLDSKGIPKATSNPWKFENGTKYKSAVDAHPHEGEIWELLSILFDSHYEDVPDDLDSSLKQKYEQRMVKERLAAFWARLCREEATLAVATAQNSEERALAFLSMNKVAEACNALVEGKNFRLATLVAQIGGDEVVHDDIRHQIDEWRQTNALSEISDVIRTIYELLAGNTCTAVGKNGNLEDRAKTFVISERFDMSWRRAFGLKLWYATLSDDPLQLVVEEYLNDLSEADIKKSLPWFSTDQDYNPVWTDTHANDREDVLWGILKLYAGTKSSAKTDLLAKVVSPENVSAFPLSSRLPFELFHSLAPLFPKYATDSGADQITDAFAAELNAAGQWVWALYTVLRLTDGQQRQQAIQKVLAQNAWRIDLEPDAEKIPVCQELQIPEAWVWEAKALDARSRRDYVKETAFLLRAKNWDEAHATLCSIVAPQAIVERSYKELQHLLDGFSEKPSTWRTGGGVYSDYLRLVQNKAGSEEGALLGRLLRVLGEMHGNKRKDTSTGGHGDFLRKVAMQDMSAVVGDMILAGASGADAKEQAWVLQLPLTGETKRTRAAELSWGYYRNIMAQGGN